ncbi:hypothetical protein EG329_013329 [Mollisiaceae sp. DMI_Dod_QoI]|nr:hypothetical protein EG329_013329 [Helotiales sp. DMI_Dod_QoI]
MGFISLYTIPTVIFSIFQCNPVDGYWNVTKPSTCVSSTPAFYVNGVCNIVVDAWLIGMVVPRIWHLKMVHKQKVALFIIITLSWMVIIAAIVRMARLGHLFKTTVIDTPWIFYDISIWTGLEVSMGIFCVSAPAIKPIFKRFAPNLLSTYGYTDSKNQYSDSSRPNDLVTSQNRHSRNAWFKNGGAIELSGQDQDAPRSESFVKGSLTRSQRLSSFWRARDVENDDRSADGVLPFMGSNEPRRMEVVKQTVVTVEVRDRKQPEVRTQASSGKSSIASYEDLNNRSVLKFSKS